jgi:hypothetical protein
VLKKLNRECTKIGVGKSFDLDLMVKIAKVGGWSSRFISDREEMEETFGSELDRMAVPLAVNLEMELEFLVDVELLDTWGYLVSEAERWNLQLKSLSPSRHNQGTVA